MKMTSAYANKMIRKLEDEKEYWTTKMTECSFYTAAEGEEPVIPAFDYVDVTEKMAAIDSKIAKIKHAINVANTSARVDVDGEILAIDEILVKMAMLNRRLVVFDRMRKAEPVVRLGMGARLGARNAVPEFRYANYDIAKASEDYENCSETIMKLQLALDRYNQTEEFEVEL